MPPASHTVDEEGVLIDNFTLVERGRFRERAIRERLTGASADLTRVDYGRLSVGARGQYDQAKRFIQQAEQAIKDQNLAFASTLADKAATLAADLAGR